MLGTGRVASSRDIVYRWLHMGDIPNMDRSLLAHPTALRVRACTHARTQRMECTRGRGDGRGGWLF